MAVLLDFLWVGGGFGRLCFICRCWDYFIVKESTFCCNFSAWISVSSGSSLVLNVCIFCWQPSVSVFLICSLLCGRNGSLFCACSYS